jgi:hypothetical protein
MKLMLEEIENTGSPRSGKEIVKRNFLFPDEFTELCKTKTMLISFKVFQGKKKIHLS